MPTAPNVRTVLDAGHKVQWGWAVALYLVTKGLAAGAAVLAPFLVWLGVARLSRMSSAGALAASAAAPVAALVFGPSGSLALLVLLAVLIWMKHHANIRRIIAGREPKIGEKS